MSRQEISRRSFLSTAMVVGMGRRLLRAAPDFSADVKVVNVFATVRNKDGEIIRDLTRDDFEIEEDGRAQQVRYFSQESNLPLTLGLLVDTSMSQRRVLGQERSASFQFLDSVLREGKDMAFLIHFDRDVELLQDLTSSRKRLEKAMDELEMPQVAARRTGGPGGGWGGAGGGPRHHGGTSLYDALLLASDELMRKQSGRKALIMLSDGVDNNSKVSLSTAIEAAQRADTLVYSILFSDREMYSRGFGGRPGMGGGRHRMPAPGTMPDGNKVLQRVSKETGGGFFEVSGKHSIEQIYDQIQQELRNQYSLGYTPEAQASPGYRHIRVAAKRKGLTVQAREGYYAAS